MEKIIIGGYYRHFKGAKIQVIAIGYDEKTQNPVVIYKHCEDGEVWVRDRFEFTGDVDKEKYPDATQDRRFVYLGESEDIHIEKNA